MGGSAEDFHSVSESIHEGEQIPGVGRGILALPSSGIKSYNALFENLVRALLKSAEGPLVDKLESLSTARVSCIMQWQSQIE